LLKLAYGKPCECCGEIMLRGTKLHLDHRIPKEVGGTDDLWNLRIVHAECNLIRAGRQFGKRASHPKRSQRW
jgi:5-methylcytosine-specific restriction endonuclease McrA